MLTVALISNGYGDNARSPVTHESLSTSLVYWFAAHRFRTSAVHQNIVVKNGTVCCWEICKSQKMSVPEFSNTYPWIVPRLSHRMAVPVQILALCDYHTFL